VLPPYLPVVKGTKYHHQQLLGGLSYLYRATGNQSYLDYTTKITTQAINTFATAAVAEELCETTGNCNQDQQGLKVSLKSSSLFKLSSTLNTSKAIFLRQLACLYLTTKDTAIRSTISNVIEKSAAAALAICDSECNCVGDWTASSTQTYPAFRSMHLVAAALVAAIGIKQG